MAMEMRKSSAINDLINKMYGGLNMSWRNVIFFAVGTAVLTAIIMIVPVFRGTSFELMGVAFEAWIFFAVIIMTNCKKPLESALKTFSTEATIEINDGSISSVDFGTLKAA